MMNRNRIWTLTMFVLLGGAAGSLAQADRPATDSGLMPVGPMKFDGRVTITARPDEQYVHSSILVWKGGVGVRNGTMTVLGHPLESRSDNRYSGTRHGTSLRGGDMVTVVFRHAWAGAAGCTASLAAPALIRLTNPLPDSHVAVGRPGNLEISWSGGTPPYKLWIHYLASGRPTQLLALASLAVGRASVPYSRFKGGTQYEITVTDGDRRFAFTREVDRTGILAMNQTAITMFHAD